MQRQELIKKFIDHLALLAHKAKINSSLNLTDINIHAETFYKDLLNLIYKYELKNINTSNINMVAIDLGDEKNRVAVQVTSLVSPEKVHSTIEKFVKNKLYLKYEKLFFLSLVEKKKFKKNIEVSNQFNFNSNTDILDYIDLAKKLQGQSIVDIEKILNFLKNELNIEKNELKKNHIANENQILISEIFRNIEKPDAEIRAWHQMSNIFYRSTVQSDNIFKSVISTPSHYEIDVNSLAIIHYFYARLLFKKGDAFKAEKHANIAIELASKATASISKRLPILINARLVIEASSLSIEYKDDKLFSLFDSLSSLNVDDKYIVSEKGSLLGRLIELVYSGSLVLSVKENSIISGWAETHNQLLRYNKMSFDKHSLVDLFLQIINTLWSENIPVDRKLGDLYAYIELGESMCKQQRNSIFYIQLLLAKAIAFHFEGKKIFSHATWFLVAKLLKYKNLTLEHEGIKQFLGFAKCKIPFEANLLYCTYRNQLEGDVYYKGQEWFEFVEKNNDDLYKIPISIFE